MTEHKYYKIPGWHPEIDHTLTDKIVDSVSEIEKNFKKAKGNVFSRGLDRLQRFYFNVRHWPNGETLRTDREIARLNTAEAVKTFTRHVLHPQGFAHASDIGLLHRIVNSGLSHAAFAARRALQHISPSKRLPDALKLMEGTAGPDRRHLKIRVRLHTSEH